MTDTQSAPAESYRRQPAFGAGLATVTNTGDLLDVWFPAMYLSIGEPGPVLSTLVSMLGTLDRGTTRLGGEQAALVFTKELAAAVHADPVREVATVAIFVHSGSLADPPTDAADAYLRLHLLSHRLTRPHTMNLDGIFGVLSTVAWTSVGPCSVDKVDAVRARVRASGQQLGVHSVDKFPRMTDYALPAEVRIADADRVRLGAYLAPGTTVMHEGFVNFNAGTLGASMVEGRISAGVVIGADTDIGGGASIIGTLSGGGKSVNSVGERCLLGANSGLGISLGDDCVVEAGCYVTGGAKLTLPDGHVVKAAELSGQSGLLFRRNSVTGALEALPRSRDWGGLNPALHTNA